MDINQPTQTVSASGPVKFDPAEIAELGGIRQSYEEITLALGQLELQKREVKKNEYRIEEKITSVEALEKAFLDKIVVKYGEGTFDINTGIFTPKKA
jgi:hypothetical protein